MKDFIKISKYSGMRNDLVQAGGGNTSVKLDERIMLVKSSGYQLADVNETVGYSKVDYRMIVDFFENSVVPTMEGKTIEAAVLENTFTEEMGKELLAKAQIEGGRASIETFLHAVTGKYTLHTHPLLVGILVTRKNAKEEIEKLFPDALFVPYLKPGAPLAEAYYKLYKHYSSLGKQTDIIFLQNHGLVVSADSGDEAIEKTQAVTKKIEEYLGLNMSMYNYATDIWKVTSSVDGLKDKICYLSENKYLQEDYVGKLMENGKWNHAFCPDGVVFANEKYLKLDESFCKQTFEKYVVENGEPTLLFYKGHVYILADTVRKAQEIENAASFLSRVQKENSGIDMRFFSNEEIGSIMNWDAEKYRKAFSK